LKRAKCERAWEVPDAATGLRVNLLGRQAEVVASREQCQGQNKIRPLGRSKAGPVYGDEGVGFAG